MTNLNEKITMKKITIVWSEALEENIEFATFAEANKAFEEVAKNYTDGSYAKTSFNVEFTDGFIYNGRIDICEEESNLTETILNHLHYHIACPEWEDKAHWNSLMNTIGWDILEKCEIILDKYSFEDTNDNEITATPKLRQATKGDLRVGTVIISPTTGEKAELLKRIGKGLWSMKMLDTGEVLNFYSFIIGDFQVEGKPRKQSKPRQTAFQKWLDTLIKEKGIDPGLTFEVEGPEYGTNLFTVQNIIDEIKTASKNEQKSIKDMLVKIDFVNGNIVNYFKHLAKAIAI